jgi:hypothetical protein
MSIRRFVYLFLVLSAMTSQCLICGGQSDVIPTKTPPVIPTPTVTETPRPEQGFELGAPALDQTVASDICSATQFLYTGADPIQTNVMSGAIDCQQAAVIRGRVLDHQSNPLSGVIVTVLGYGKFGQTQTRDDGMFDMVVNGGGLLTMEYRKSGYLLVQRQVQVPWSG